jgi:hypothetical protein
MFSLYSLQEQERQRCPAPGLYDCQMRANGLVVGVGGNVVCRLILCAVLKAALAGRSASAAGVTHSTRQHLCC